MVADSGPTPEDDSPEGLLSRAKRNLTDWNFLLALVLALIPLGMAVLAAHLFESVSLVGLTGDSLFTDLFSHYLGAPVPEPVKWLDEVVRQLVTSLELLSSVLAMGNISTVLPVSYFWFLVSFSSFKPGLMDELKRPVWLIPLTVVLSVLPAIHFGSHTVHFYLATTVLLGLPLVLRGVDLKRGYLATAPAAILLAIPLIRPDLIPAFPLEFGELSEVTAAGTLLMWLPAATGLGIWSLTARAESVSPASDRTDEDAVGFFNLSGPFRTVLRRISSPEVLKTVALSAGILLGLLVVVNGLSLASLVLPSMPASEKLFSSQQAELLNALTGAGSGVAFVLALSGLVAAAAVALSRSREDLADCFLPLAWSVFWLLMLRGGVFLLGATSIILDLSYFPPQILSALTLIVLAAGACYFSFLECCRKISRRLFLALLTAAPFMVLGKVWTLHSTEFLPGFNQSADPEIDLAVMLVRFSLLTLVSFAGVLTAVWAFLLSSEEDPLGGGPDGAAPASSENSLLDSS